MLKTKTMSIEIYQKKLDDKKKYEDYLLKPKIGHFYGPGGNISHDACFQADPCPTLSELDGDLE